MTIEKMSLLVMPDEVLATIFENLSKHAVAMSACVCRRFHNLAVEPLYRDIAFQAPSHYSEEQAGPRDVFKFYNLLRSLAVDPSLTLHIRSFYLQAWHVTAFFKSSLTVFQKPLEFPSLTSLEFEYGSMTIQNLTDVLHRTPMLRRLYCKFNLIYKQDGLDVRCLDFESLGHALKLVSNTMEELALTLDTCYDNQFEDDDIWNSPYRVYKLKGHLGSALRDCLNLKRLTTQISILLGVTHDTKISLLDVLPLTLLQLSLVDASHTVGLGEWLDPMLVDRLFDYLHDGAIKAGLKHLFVDTQASQGGFGVDLPGGIRVLRYDENEWAKLKRVVLSNHYDFSYDQNIVWINTLQDPCEQLICEMRLP